ncbi:hypothetical protein OJ253_1434 [Cryptosporidium canis]|uniref:Uncharacterized protein n=1 Tax=Cryptosporidium canis TaxID=195482 RepID=A0A9D5HVA9_9CRYT|nr:hypothetical protein OJ253_1434 [Cryptosporidium canis]
MERVGAFEGAALAGVGDLRLQSRCRKGGAFLVGAHGSQVGENVMENQSGERRGVVLSGSVQLVSGRGGRLSEQQDGGLSWIREYSIGSGTEGLEKGDSAVLADGHSGDAERDAAVGVLEVPNIPFSLLVSYFRQERSQVCRRIHSVWIGYKTRSILRGSLRGFGTLGSRDGETRAGSPGVVVCLGYTIHKILLSILDLYDLILDEESRTGSGGLQRGLPGGGGSWLDAMYEQVGDFKRRYIAEVDSALQGEGGRRWVSDIVRARQTSKRDISRPPRETKGLLPSRFEVRYVEKMQMGDFGGDVARHACPTSLEWDGRSLPYALFELTPGVARRAGGFPGGLASFADEATPTALRGAKASMYFTPSSFVRRANACGEDQDSSEFYTPAQEEACGAENQDIGQRAGGQVKPKPYLKRKSKSILPPKETSIELDKVTSKVRELYTGRGQTEKKIFKSVPVSGGYEQSGSRIPSISSSLSIISDSPCSRNSSSKVSRIPSFGLVFASAGDGDPAVLVCDLLSLVIGLLGCWWGVSGLGVGLGRGLFAGFGAGAGLLSQAGYLVLESLDVYASLGEEILGLDGVDLHDHFVLVPVDGDGESLVVALELEGDRREDVLVGESGGGRQPVDLDLWLGFGGLFGVLRRRRWVGLGDGVLVVGDALQAPQVQGRRVDIKDVVGYEEAVVIAGVQSVMYLKHLEEEEPLVARDDVPVDGDGGDAFGGLVYVNDLDWDLAAYGGQAGEDREERVFSQASNGQDPVV